jgi:hypothetical protein
MQPGLTIEYNPDRPWYEQWHKVREHMATVEAEC